MAAVDPRSAYPASPSNGAAPPPNPVDLARYAQATIAKSISEELDPSDRLIAMSAESKLMQVRARSLPCLRRSANGLSDLHSRSCSTRGMGSGSVPLQAACSPSGRASLPDGTQSARANFRGCSSLRRRQDRAASKPDRKQPRRQQRRRRQKGPRMEESSKRRKRRRRRCGRVEPSFSARPSRTAFSEASSGKLRASPPRARDNRDIDVARGTAEPRLASGRASRLPTRFWKTRAARTPSSAGPSAGSLARRTRLPSGLEGVSTPRGPVGPSPAREKPALTTRRSKGWVNRMMAAPVSTILLPVGN